MPESAKFLLIISFIGALLCFVKMLKTEHFFKNFLLSSLSGIGSLFSINLIAFITGIKLSINWFTLGFCSLTGIGGSIYLLLINSLGNIR